MLFRSQVDGTRQFLYAVSGTTLYQINSSFVGTSLGTLPGYISGTRMFSIAGFNQVAFSDGTNLYVSTGGAAPVQAAILEGDQVTGISLMQMEAGLDTGPVLAHARVEIGADETAGELQDRLAALGGELLVQKLPEILEGKLEPLAQDDALATYAGKIRKQNAAIDWGHTEIGRAHV